MAQMRKPSDEHASAGGWGAVNAAEQQLGKQGILLRGNRVLLSMNKPGGFDCPSCAWPDPKVPHVAEYCENGAKAVAGKPRESARRRSFLRNTRWKSSRAGTIMHWKTMAA